MLCESSASCEVICVVMFVGSFKPIQRVSPVSESSLAGLFSSTGGDSTPTARRPAADQVPTVTQSTMTAGLH